MWAVNATMGVFSRELQRDIGHTEEIEAMDPSGSQGMPGAARSWKMQRMNSAVQPPKAYGPANTLILDF